MKSELIEVHEGQLFVGTWKLSNLLNIQHRLFKINLERHEKHFSEFGKLIKRKVITEKKGGQPYEYLLNSSHLKLFFSILSMVDFKEKIMNIKKMIVSSYDFNDTEFFNFLEINFTNWRLKEPPKIIKKVKILKERKFNKKDGYIYVIERDNGNIKIGQSKDPRTRIKALRDQTYKMKINKCYISKLSDHCKMLEYKVHQELKEHAIGHEWFNINFEKAVTILKKYEMDLCQRKATH